MEKQLMWGNSTSSMQTEGAFDLDGKGKSVYDIREASENQSDWKVAIDEYHRYEEDIRLMKEMGANSYRFQISWSRVLPKGHGEINEKGLEFYDRLISCLEKYQIEPIICLYHFDMPLYLSEKYNGFSSKKVIDYFFEFSKIIIDRYHKRVKYWLTFNEHNLYSSDFALTIAGSNLEVNPRNIHQVQYNTLVGHGWVAKYIHDNYKDLKIGGMLAYTTYYPYSSKPEDNYIRNSYEDFDYNLYLNVFTQKGYMNTFKAYLEKNSIILEKTDQEEKIINNIKSDFIAFSYYRSATLKYQGKDYSPLNTDVFVNNEYLDRNEWNWEIDPKGLEIAMVDIYNRTNLPVFIVENGIGLREELPENKFIEDDKRIVYLKSHFDAMAEAMDKGVECMGYLGWGFIDILSSSGNMDKRYGVVYVNRDNHDLKDLRRIKKKSFAYVKQVFESNGKERKIK